jgi:hypothetical protein
MRELALVFAPVFFSAEASPSSPAAFSLISAMQAPRASIGAQLLNVGILA